MIFNIIVLSIGLISTVNGQNCAGDYAQCGGQDWQGPLCCVEGLICKVQSQWYSQCQPNSTLN